MPGGVCATLTVMPAQEESHPLFAERLSLPWHWWVVATVGVAVGGAEVFAGLPWWAAVIVYAALGLPVLALLIGMGRARVWVDDTGVHAGRDTLPLADIAAVTVLDALATRARIGPAADPRARTMTRGWVKTAVELTPLDDVAVPYWLVSTRRPEELADAVRTAVLRHRS